MSQFFENCPLWAIFNAFKYCYDSTTCSSHLTAALTSTKKIENTEWYIKNIILMKHPVKYRNRKLAKFLAKVQFFSVTIHRRSFHTGQFVNFLRQFLILTLQKMSEKLEILDSVFLYFKLFAKNLNLIDLWCNFFLVQYFSFCTSKIPIFKGFEWNGRKWDLNLGSKAECSWKCTNLQVGCNVKSVD